MEALYLADMPSQVSPETTVALRSQLGGRAAWATTRLRNKGEGTTLQQPHTLEDGCSSERKGGEESKHVERERGEDCPVLFKMRQLLYVLQRRIHDFYFSVAAITDSGDLKSNYPRRCYSVGRKTGRIPSNCALIRGGQVNYR